METKDFEQALPKVLKRIGLKENGWLASQLISKSPILMEVPEDFDFKSVLGNSFKQCGIELIYVDCKTDTPDSIFTKLDSIHRIDSSVRNEKIEKKAKTTKMFLLCFLLITIQS